MASTLVANINRTQWPADAVSRRSLASLVPYAKNVRTHSPEQIQQIAASIREWGFTVPVLVDDAGTLIAGHGRVLAAQSLGLTDVPTMIATGWTAEQIRAYRLADNKLTLNGGWDDDALKFELAELQDAGFDLGLTGFGEHELMGLLGSTAGLTDPDDVPDAPDEPVTQPGDVWLLGRHRLVCGDATSEVDVSLALAGVRPHLMVTDPPYGVDFDPTWRKGSEKRTYMGDMLDNEGIWHDAWTLFPGDVVYIWHADRHMRALYATLEQLGFLLRQQIVWNKGRFIIGRGNYCHNHEPCFYGVRKNGSSHWQGANNQPTVWDIEHKASDTNHGAQKPVQCMQRPIENSSSIGQAVYEPFCGSGTTIIAAEMTGRAAHCIEISPQYCDVSVLRWQAFTGSIATHATTGETFEARAHGQSRQETVSAD